ncbi:MAG: single-stranded-DNA-specific exonuclease RecJ [Alphaproteobacteria bacterium]|nr:single-stranded-DNA-specific exonuclease RecJ [Alphaproteobacteria bacterium]
MSAPAIDQPPALGVRSSFTGQCWRLADADDRLVQAMVQRHGLPDIVARLLACRGVDIETAADFLNPTIRTMLPALPALRDLDRACERLVRAIAGGETVAVFGDYDVDGATSSALMLRFLRAVGASPLYYVPDRIREGYGPNAEAMRHLRAQGASVVVTVDCGTTATAPLAAAREAGLDVIVVDHHQADAALPPCAALVNPNRQDEDLGLQDQFRSLAAVGVAFLLVAGVNSALQAAGWFGQRPRPNPLDWLDLVALGTVCDVVPLNGLNRALVAQGLKVMARRGNPGLAALADVAGMTEPPGTYHAGFQLGPRVNAGGRVGRSDLGTRLLSTDDPVEARVIAEELDRLNEERKAIEQMVQEAAVAGLESAGRDEMILVASGEGWHPGVIGIVAGRLKEKYRRPTFVIAVEGGIGKGSGRSVMGVDLGAAVRAAAQAGLLENGGGHSMAAGLTVREERIPELRAFLAAHLASRVAAGGEASALRVDSLLTVAGATPALIDLLEQAGPYGAGHREPRFALPQARLVKADVVGENHVRCILSGRDGGRLKAIAFRAMDGPLGPALLTAARNGTPLHVAGHLRADRWMGRVEAQLMIDDAAAIL